MPSAFSAAAASICLPSPRPANDAAAGAVVVAEVAGGGTVTTGGSVSTRWMSTPDPRSQRA